MRIIKEGNIEAKDQERYMRFLKECYNMFTCSKCGLEAVLELPELKEAYDNIWGAYCPVDAPRKIINYLMTDSMTKRQRAWKYDFTPVATHNFFSQTYTITGNCPNCDALVSTWKRE